jgi:hypothetical protein
MQILVNPQNSVSKLNGKTNIHRSIKPDKSAQNPSKFYKVFYNKFCYHQGQRVFELHTLHYDTSGSNNNPRYSLRRLHILASYMSYILYKL